MSDDKSMKLMMAQMNQKNVSIGVLLTFFFGGLGLFYASIAGGIIMTILELIAWATTLIGIGFLLLPIIHIGCIIWAVVAINNHNKKLLQMATS